MSGSLLALSYDVARMVGKTLKTPYDLMECFLDLVGGMISAHDHYDLGKR